MLGKKRKPERKKKNKRKPNDSFPFLMLKIQIPRFFPFKLRRPWVTIQSDPNLASWGPEREKKKAVANMKADIIDSNIRQLHVLFRF